MGTIVPDPKDEAISEMVASLDKEGDGTITTKELDDLFDSEAYEECDAANPERFASLFKDEITSRAVP